MLATGILLALQLKGSVSWVKAQEGSRTILGSGCEGAVHQQGLYSQSSLNMSEELFASDSS